MNLKIENVVPEDDFQVRDRVETLTPDMQTWAAVNLDPLPTRVVLDEREAYIARNEDGQLFRFAFNITVVPAENSVFLVKMFAGASSEDLAQAQRLVERAKQGWFYDDIWDRQLFTKPRRAEGWIMDRGLLTTGEEHRDVLMPCNEPACIEDYHAVLLGDEAQHETEALSDPDGWYTVRAFKDDNSEWRAFFDVSTLDALEGPEDLPILERALNDYKWVLGEAEKLNQAAQELTIKRAA